MKWEEVRLGDVLSKIIGGGTPSKSNKSYWNGTILWCSVKDMSDGKYFLDTTQDTITEEGLKNSSSNLIPRNTVITATRMGLGRAFINSVDMAINQDLKALIPNDKITTNFLLWTIILNSSKLESLGSGATVKGIRLETLKDLRIKLPPLKTQKKIAKILSNYDNLIDNNLKQIKLLEEKARLTYEEWFLRFRVDGVELEIDSDSGLPFGWKEKKIKDICTISGGGTPSTSKEEYWTDGDILWFSPTDLSKSNSICLLKSTKTINTLGIKKSSAKILSSDSFMMTSRATIGLFGLIEKPFSTNQGFINITPKRLEEKYYLFFNFKSRINEFKGLATGSTFPELSRGKFKMLKIVFPTKEFINEFHIIINPIIKQLFNLQNQNQNLKEARDILLPRLMTGVIS